MDKLKGAKYFTKLDVRWGYNNIQIRKGDKWKVAFKTNKGLFKPTVMFFGMCNSLTMFQSMMDKHLYHHDRRKIGDCLHRQHPHICQNKRRTYTDHENGTGETTGK